MAIDLGTVVVFSNGVRVINVTPHSITFRDRDVDVTVVPCGAKVNAKAVEVEVGERDTAQLVKTVFVESSEGLAELDYIENYAPEVLVVGSIISAQAYPGRVLGMTPAAGFERVAPAEKRMSTLKFTTF